MKAEEIIDEMARENHTEVIWKALCVTKVRSAFVHKYGIDLIETGIIQPTLITNLMDESVYHIVEALMESMGRRN